MAQRPFLKGTTVDVSQVLEYLHSDCYLSKRCAAAYLAWSVRKLGYCLSEIPHYRHRGSIYFRRSDLDAYLADFRIEPGPSEQSELQRLAEASMAKLHEA